jgi:hypothetical protein
LRRNIGAFQFEGVGLSRQEGSQREGNEAAFHLEISCPEGSIADEV